MNLDSEQIRGRRRGNLRHPFGPVLAGGSADVTGGYGLAFVGIAAMFVVAALALTQVHGLRPLER